MPTKPSRYPTKQVDAILPLQLFGRSKKLAPERRLMIAVLADAVNCIAKYRFATDVPGQRLFDAEQEWLFSDDTQWPYSFEYICDALDLDADAVRQSLGSIAVQQPAAVQHAMPITAFQRALHAEQSADRFTAKG